MLGARNAEQVFALAARIEHLGVEFYARAVERVDDPVAATVLKGFIQQEMEHERTFNDLRRAWGEGRTSEGPPLQGTVPGYLEAAAKGTFFGGTNSAAKRWNGNESVSEVLKTALRFEREAIAFFIGLRPIAANAQDRAQIDRIVQEEMGHIAQLSGLLSSCAFDLKAAIDTIGSGTCLVLTHDNPDPDALAAALGLRDLLNSETALDLTIGYGGTIGRAENRAMLSCLGLPFLPIHPSELERFDHIALVDCQPGGGNTMVADGFPADIVVDHHPRRSWTPASPWTDVRQSAGSTASIVYTYLLERRTPISTELATALVYGIVSDTMDLGRGATPLEYGAYVDLFPRCDMTALGRIRRPDLPREHFRSLNRALEAALTYENRLVAAPLADIPFPDLPAEIADMLLRLQGAECTLCTGRYENDLRISLRTQQSKSDATALLLKVMDGRGSGGGHEHMAGGAMMLEGGEDAQTLGRQLADRLAVLMDIQKPPSKLVNPGG